MALPKKTAPPQPAPAGNSSRRGACENGRRCGRSGQSRRGRAGCSDGMRWKTAAIRAGCTSVPRVGKGWRGARSPAPRAGPAAQVQQGEGCEPCSSGPRLGRTCRTCRTCRGGQGAGHAWCSQSFRRCICCIRKAPVRAAISRSVPRQNRHGLGSRPPPPQSAGATGQGRWPLRDPGRIPRPDRQMRAHRPLSPAGPRTSPLFRALSGPIARGRAMGARP